MSDDPRDIISRHIERTTGIYDTDCADAILAEIGKAHAIVPKEPTAKMLMAMWDTQDKRPEAMETATAQSRMEPAYRAMLAAAPPVAQGGEK